MHLKFVAGLAALALISIAIGTVAVDPGWAQPGNPQSVEIASSSSTTNDVAQNSQGATLTDEATAYATLKSTCMGCHDLSMLTSRPFAASEWPSVLSKMKGLGANLTDQETELLERYLAKTYSPPSK